MAFCDCLSLWQICLIISLLVISILYLTSRTFKFYLKITVYNILAYIIGSGTAFYGLPRPRNPNNNLFVTFWVNNFLSPLLGVDVEIRGRENLKKDEPLVIVVNHQSAIDMLAVFGAWPDNCVIVSKKELLWTGLFGLGAWLCGTVFVNRVDSQSARNAMNSASERIKNKRLKVLVFPEGTRSMTGSMGPFKKGAFHLAVDGQIPIVPAVVSSYDNFYSPKEKRFDEGKVIIEFLPQIPTAGLKVSDVTDLTERTRNIMLEHFTRLSKEVKAIR